jgi:predicted phosphodiesterase
MRHRTLAFVLLVALVAPSWIEKISLPLKPESLKFAVLGDTGTGGRAQRDIGQRLAESRNRFSFDFVIMLGDNLYGGESPRDYEEKFEQPYQALLSAGVKFYAVLGNHDKPDQSRYKLFNMNGKRYYTFTPHRDVRFFALDSNYLDREQIEWAEKELRSSGEKWKICFFHHPLYSSGRKHGPSLELRQVLEPLFTKYGVSVVFAGHEHFYERLKPQIGIYYFIAGGSAKLREGGIVPDENTIRGFDRDESFMLVEIADNAMYFSAISRTGGIFDSGEIDLPRTDKQ